tara:strand:+ start:210 stop:1025 length:816 start_codon:yes stop_codon:yes gene_type:complete
MINLIQNTIGALGRRATSSPSFVGLLDTYSGASVAYSLRQLDSTYTGSAIRVRRSSDNVEQDIGFTNNVLDTASLLTFVGSGDGFVDTWYDQSGNAKDMTQATASKQSKIVSSGVVELDNGKPCLLFDGSNDEMNAVLASPLAQPNTYAYVANYSGVLSSSTNTSARNLIYEVGGSVRLYSGASVLSNLNATPQKIAFALFDNTNSYLSVNASANYTGTAGTQSQESIRLFRDSNAGIGNGKVQSFIVYNSDKSAIKTDFITNLNDYYGAY